MQEIKAENIKSKTRIDLFLSNHFPNITRSTAKKVILNGLVTLNKEKVKPNKYIKDNDTIEIDIDDIRRFVESYSLTELIPVKMDLDIIFEDENTIILNKPSGLVVHPVYQHKEDTLMNGLTFYVINNNSDPFVKVRPVHRLDKDTSGIILISKNLEAHNFYTNQFKKHQIEKTYIAVVKGDFKKVLNEKEFLNVQSFISKIARDRRYSVTNSSSGDLAETDFFFEKYLDNNQEYSLVRVLPKTGRTHQIRVHLAELQYPIAGDVIYQGEEYSRLMLHAWKLKVKLFGSDEIKTFEAKIPEDFVKFPIK